MNDQLYKRNKTNRDFLLSFFDQPDKYEVKKVNGFYLIKQLIKHLNSWTVAVFTEKDYLKREKHRQKFSHIFKPRENSESEDK